jgi:hypothetical protein
MIARLFSLRGHPSHAVAKTFAAFALACGLSVSARAQIGSGWTPTTEAIQEIQTSSGCTATSLPAGSGVGGVFSVPSGSGRSEYRFQDLSSTVLEQFQGDVTVNSVSTTGRITMKQTFGPEPSTPWSLIAIRPISGGTSWQIYDVENGTTLLNHYVLGSTIRINTIYNPLGGAGNVTDDIYINGSHAEQLANGTGPNYNKIGCYVSSSGSGPATFTWENVLFWTGGTINGGTPVPVDTPYFSPVAGIYTSAQSVTLATTTSGATIRYTTDGSTPSETRGTLYAGAIPIGSTTTINAIAYESGQTDSAVSTSVYTIVQAATPTFSPPAGTYTSAQSVAISSTTSGASISYTTDGSTPTETHGTVVSNGGTVLVSTNTTLKAIAFESGYADSNVGTAIYTITPPAATPTFGPGTGTYTSAQSVAISSTTSGASISYTTDGSTPTETHGTVVSNGGTVLISTNTTLKAIAFESGYTDSTVGTAIYTITPPAAQPTFSPPAGTYTSGQSVAISTTTPGASINYTTDSSPPTETHGTPYTVPVSISTTTTLKAMAFESGYTDSTVASGIYTISAPIPTMPRVQGSDGNRQP